MEKENLPKPNKATENKQSSSLYWTPTITKQFFTDVKNSKRFWSVVTVLLAALILAVFAFKELKPQKELVQKKEEVTQVQNEAPHQILYFYKVGSAKETCTKVDFNTEEFKKYYLNGVTAIRLPCGDARIVNIKSKNKTMEEQFISAKTAAECECQRKLANNK